MPTLTEHLIKLTDHRDRELLELTLAKALINLLVLQRVVVARVRSEDGEQRWFDVVSLDARGGGKVTDPLRTDFKQLKLLGDLPDRRRCLESGQVQEVAWAGADGPRITYLPLFEGEQARVEEGVLEIHSAAPLVEAERLVIGQLRHVYRNMYALLAYSDRDALTGFLNRKSLDDVFYRAVLEEIEGVQTGPVSTTQGEEAERRHRVPPNYWLATINIDHFGLLNDKHGHLVMEEVVLLVARVMGNTFRAHDRLYRFGDDRFAVLFHCPEEANAFSAMDRMRANVERFKFPQLGQATVSAGFTRVLQDDTPNSALERCDQALEFAQKHGHNKVCSHLDLVRRGVFDEQVRTGPVDIF